MNRFARALLDPWLPCPPGLQAWNGSHPAHRFAVHRNNSIASLADALADTFPVVQALVGEEFFRAMAAAFVRAHPPASPLLHAYGQRFAEFIAGFGPARPLAYLADVARLERARVDACHAADAPPLSPAAATGALACGGRVGALRLVPHPAARWLVSPHPVFSLWAAHQGEGALEDVDLSRAEGALVVRPGFEVLVLRCGPGAVALLDCAARGGELAACVAAAVGAEDGFDLAGTLSLLMAHGALAAIALPQGPRA